MKDDTQTISLIEAALRLQLTYQAVRDRILRGALRGGRDSSGHWYAEEADVARQEREQKTRRAPVARAPGRSR